MTEVWKAPASYLDGCTIRAVVQALRFEGPLALCNVSSLKSVTIFEEGVWHFLWLWK